jgi:hypothetical protein
MKTKLIILACVASTAFGADMTITIPTADVPRVQEAYGSILNLGRPANLAEVQRATTDWIHQSTVDYERRKNMVTFSPPPMAMQPSPSPTAGGLKAAPAKAAPKPTATPKKKK